jgi:hypothetical protein
LKYLKKKETKKGYFSWKSGDERLETEILELLN